MTNPAPLQSVYRRTIVSVFVTCFLVTCTERSPEDVASLTDVDSLIEELKDEDKDVRVSAADALGGIGPGAKAAVPHLIEALKDENWNVRTTVAYALGRIGPDIKAAVPHLIEALKDEDRLVRVGVAEALVHIGSDARAEAINSLIEALKDENENVHQLAANDLGRIATVLQNRKATTAIPDLEMALAALEAMNVGSNKLVKEARAAARPRVRRAVEALKAIEKSR